jgi:hypothetical protein
MLCLTLPPTFFFFSSSVPSTVAPVSGPLHFLFLCLELPFSLSSFLYLVSAQMSPLWAQSRVPALQAQSPKSSNPSPTEKKKKKKPNKYHWGRFPEIVLPVAPIFLLSSYPVVFVLCYSPIPDIVLRSYLCTC